MKKVFKKLKFLLIILCSLWLLISAAYLHYSTLDDFDIAPPFPCLKNIDQDDSILNSEKKEKVLELTFSINHIFITKLILPWVPNFLHQLPPLNLKSLILRC
jgi:hypothetical protein